jgi:hypothetical protein
MDHSVAIKNDFDTYLPKIVLEGYYESIQVSKLVLNETLIAVVDIDDYRECFKSLGIYFSLVTAVSATELAGLLTFSFFDLDGNHQLLMEILKQYFPYDDLGIMLEEVLASFSSACTSGR